MGDGGLVDRLPSLTDAAFIRDGLNDLFGPKLKERTDGSGTRDKHKHLKGRYPFLLKHSNSPGVLDKKQRSLRHAAWLLTDEIFATAKPGHSPTFRYWLRWLTWLERRPPSGSVVVVDGVQQGAGGMTPAQAILDTLDKSIDRTKTIKFTWSRAPDAGPHLAVAVDRRDVPYTIEVASRRWDEIENAPINYPKETDLEDEI